MDIAVIGAGYVGLVQAAGLTYLGHRVRVGEASRNRVASLERGEIPIFEPGLAELLDRASANGLISYHIDNVDAVTGAEVVFLTLPTPTGGNGHADLSVIEGVVDQLAPHLDGSQVLVVKSTVPVGTTSRLSSGLREAGCLVGVVSNPEFLAEGNAVEDFLRAERVVIGAIEPDHGRRVAELYRGLESEIVLTDPTSAELIKYGANAYLATRLTFANSLADIADVVGADVLAVVQGIGLDRRIGPHFMRPGPGYGGSCFPKDTRAMLTMTGQAGYDFQLLRAVIDSNSRHQMAVIDKAIALLGGSAAGRAVGVWGIAFKAGTDDTRESPALVIAKALADAGARVRSFDPEARTSEVPIAESAVAAALDADLLIVATEWPEFHRIDLAEVAKAMRGDIVYDARNLLDPAKVQAAGLRYVGLGRGALTAET